MLKDIIFSFAVFYFISSYAFLDTTCQRAAYRTLYAAYKVHELKKLVLNFPCVVFHAGIKISDTTRQTFDFNSA